MKKTLLLLAALMGITACGSESSSTAASDVSGFRLTQIAGTQLSGDESERLYTYDNSGNVAQVRYVETSGTQVSYRSTATQTYNDAGQLIQQVKQEVDFQRTTTPANITTTAYTYNSEGQLSQTTQTNSANRPNYTVIYAYNSSGQLIQTAEKSIEGDTTETATYNSSGQVAQTISIGNLISLTTTTFAYNAVGVLTQRVDSYSDVNITEIYTYNSLGQLIQRGTLHSDGRSAAVSYTYESISCLPSFFGIASFEPTDSICRE